MKRLIYISLSILLMLSCSTDLEIPLPEHEPRLTLYSFLSEGTPIDISVSRSFGLTEKVWEDDIKLTDANVEVYRNGDFLDKMIYKDSTVVDTLGVFTFSPGPGQPDTTIYATQEFEGSKYFPTKILDYPKAGETYKFVVSHPLYGQAEGETTIPRKPNFTQIELKKDSLTFVDIEGYEMKWSALKIKVDDPPETENYYNYFLGITYEEEVEFGDSTQTFIFNNWQQPGTEILSYPDGYTYVENSPASDEEFIEANTSLWWFYFPTNYINGREEELNYLELGIAGISMTKAYAQFQDKLRTQILNRLSGIESAFIPSEPVVIPSNVEGGYGVIGAFNQADLYTLDLR